MGSLELKMNKQCVFCLFLKLVVISSIDSIDRNSVTQECQSNKTLLQTNLLNNTCCIQNETHWLVQDKENLYQCKKNECYKRGGFFYKGECIKDLYEDAICGKQANGERLFVGKDGTAYCDCDEGWVRYEEKCYQEFSPAFCAVDHEILKLNKPPSSCKNIFFPDQLKVCIRGKRDKFSCIKNPCPPSSYPHRYVFIFLTENHIFFLGQHGMRHFIPGMRPFVINLRLT